MTKLERVNPSLIALAAKVLSGQHIYYRRSHDAFNRYVSSYWLGNLQLTYSEDTTGGVRRDLGKPHSAANAELAEHILRKCLAAREQPGWGTRWERQRRILVGLREETLPAFRRGHFCHWRHASLDAGCLYMSGWSGRSTASMRLVGDKTDAECEHTTLEAAIEGLWVTFAPAGERPPWHGEAQKEEVDR